jgi:hypothetical protein
LEELEAQEWGGTEDMKDLKIGATKNQLLKNFN